MELYSEFQLIVSCFPLLFTLTALVELILAEAGRYSQFGFRIVKKKKKCGFFRQRCISQAWILHILYTYDHKLQGSC